MANPRIDGSKSSTGYPGDYISSKKASDYWDSPATESSKRTTIATIGIFATIALTATLLAAQEYLNKR